MNYWTSSSIQRRNTVIRGYLTNVSPLRIGSGRESPLGATVDLAVLRITYKTEIVPYIPGSSLKGLFRSNATAIAKSSGIDVCSGLSKETCMDKKYVKDRDRKERTLRDYVKDNLISNNPENAMRAFWENACLMCKLFGAPGYAGKLSFSDAYPVDEAGNLLPVRLGTRTGIAIDRRTGAVMSHALYTVEYVEPGAKFRFNIMCKNVPNYALGLLGMILRMIDEGQIRIGGFKTRGFGIVRVEDLEFMNIEYPRTDSTVLRSMEDVDSQIDVGDLVKVERGSQVARGENAWKVLEKLEEAWKNAFLKSRSP